MTKTYFPRKIWKYGRTKLKSKCCYNAVVGDYFTVTLFNDKSAGLDLPCAGPEGRGQGMAFRWRVYAGPNLVVFGSSMP